MNDEDQKNFFDYITTFLNLPGDTSSMPNLSIADARAQIGVDTGISLSLNLLRELGHLTNPSGENLLTSSLSVLLESLKAYRPGALYSVSDRMSFQLDQSLNEAREFLAENLERHLQRGVPNKELASVTLKLIFMLGVVRSSIEDFLIVLSFMQKYPMLDFVDLTPELSICYKFYGFTLESSTEAKNIESAQQYSIGKQNVLTTTPLSNLLTGGALFELRSTQGDRMICDNEFIYFYKHAAVPGFNPGIYKMSQTRMVGRVVQSNSLSEMVFSRTLQNLDSQMVLIQGKIFMKYQVPEKKNL